MTIPSNTIEKLGKLFPRLATDHDGEVIATVRAIIRTLESAGSSLHELGPGLTPKIEQKIVYREKVVYRDKPVKPTAPGMTPNYERVGDWKNIVRLADVLLAECDLNDRETGFIQQIRSSAERMKSKFGMTTKQRDWWKSLLNDYNIREETP